jgi:ketosteroid isomerase-like protein
MMNKHVFSTPQEAEQAFYSALEQADLDAMMAVWETSDAIVCIHPMGSRLQGILQIRKSWQQIFQSNHQLKFQIDDVKHIVEDRLAIRMIVENITIVAPRSSRSPQPILATNIYRRSRDGWYMILHHASAPPEDNLPPSANQVLH